MIIGDSHELVAAAEKCVRVANICAESSVTIDSNKDDCGRATLDTICCDQSIELFERELDGDREISFNGIIPCHLYFT